MMKTSVWEGCYDENLKSLITPESFAHPAKMAKKLCERIFEHGAEQGYWQPGAVIIDPFAGIGTTGLIGAYRGYQVISVELEPRFVEMHDANIGRNAAKLRRLGKPLPIILQGDARRLSEIAMNVVGIISSPPYAEGIGHSSEHPRLDEKLDEYRRQHGTARRNGYQVQVEGAISSPPYASGGHHPDQTGAWGGQAQALTEDQAGYGKQDGQIGQLQEGKFESVVGSITSPPYEDQPIEKNSGSIDFEKQYQTYRAQGGGASFESFVRTQQLHSQGYGASNGQIGALHGGDFESVVGSITRPPYEAAQTGGTEIYNKLEETWNRKLTDKSRHAGYRADLQGDTEGQIGNENGETYWQAMAEVYGQLFMVLKPGGVAAIVVKDFVRNKQRVPLCDRTAQLLEAIGFTVVERTRVMLVKETHAGIDLFTGKHITKRVERKSFFRRLAESKGSPRIDWEEVIWARKIM